jgi:hypothetical protein
MAALKDKVQTSLDEARILVLGIQVLLGFELRSIFEKSFAEMPEWAQALKLTSLCAMIVAFALIALPASYHRVVAGGEDRPDVHAFATGVISLALLPFAVGLGLDLTFSLVRVLGPRAAAAAGAGATALALGAWYGLTAVARRRRGHGREESPMEPTKLEQKIHHVLTETRMVLPGAQALLGFQLAVTLMEPFRELDRGPQLVHVAALGLVAVAIVLLMTPAAYHRIVEGGEMTEHFHRVASGFVIAAMPVLAAGLAADVYVAFHQALESRAVAGAAAIATLLLCVGLWFGLTLAARGRRRSGAPGAAAREAAAHR